MENEVAPTHLVTQLNDSLEFLQNAKENLAEDDNEAHEKIDKEIAVARRNRNRLQSLCE